MQDPHLFSKFLPTVISLMVDDQIRSVSARIPDATASPPELPTDLYAIYIKSNPLASLVAMYYVLQVIVCLSYCVQEKGCESMLA